MFSLYLSNVEAMTWWCVQRRSNDLVVCGVTRTKVIIFEKTLVSSYLPISQLLQSSKSLGFIKLFNARITTSQSTYSGVSLAKRLESNEYPLTYTNSNPDCFTQSVFFSVDQQCVQF
ncbi:hypothetical protein Bca52824_048551 [Brassica carinata]|uniref:Uncharacterized protein n=1 Tax=Brassica carinata TaxID=52824 RepID=A0A8X7USA4_BRACI|nr:hypothetical protein Bca52824_048551 [Brassica carinata]